MATRAAGRSLLARALATTDQGGLRLTPSTFVTGAGGRAMGGPAGMDGDLPTMDLLGCC
ncbi:MAG: hypothetical protein M3063_08010 [Actinomycetota bacterium]|nr:hypothetical protein [Actinomycetota bacterium]